MANDYKNNPKIKLGDKQLLDDSYEDKKNHKMRITSWIDGDIYQELKRRSEQGEGDGRYQTLLNQILRQSLFEKDDQMLLANTVVKALKDSGYKVTKPTKRRAKKSA